MELLFNGDEYVVVNGDSALVCSRTTTKLSVQPPKSLELDELACLGQVYGVVGKLCIKGYDSDACLLLVSKQTAVGRHPLTSGQIFQINQVIALPLSVEESVQIPLQNGCSGGCGLGIDLCSKHSGCAQNGPGGASLAFLNKGQKKMLKTTVSSLKFVSERMNFVSKSPRPEEDYRRLMDEILRLFESGSFYYSRSTDLTNSVHRLQRKAEFDDRFFWNRHMLLDLICPESQAGSAKEDIRIQWVVPIIQGFVSCQTCFIPTITDESFSVFSSSPQSPLATKDQKRSDDNDSVAFDLCLISRRSVHRAGTRYIKRGVNKAGHCANYVETEQLLYVAGHVLSFVQCRGSIPLFWSQHGYKYKPPPCLEGGYEDNQLAFSAHFSEQVSIYGESIVAINLVEQSGREKVLSDAYIRHVLDYNSEKLTYIAFDFHEHCRGLRFENVATLTSALVELCQLMRFCWVDKHGDVVCQQESIFRTNCVDCLDRTNVVQTAIAKMLLETQLRKLGLLLPECSLPKECLVIFQDVWANNGDVISRQYAGTAALKGDFTRTGQRNLAGVMKDGYNSANRYYLSHVKDARRQAAIDALLGKETRIEKLYTEPEPETEETWLKQKDEEMRLLVQDCLKLVIPANEVLLGGWALINADMDTGDESQQDMNTIVMLTRQAYYVTDYDEDRDKFLGVERVSLDAIERIEVGPLTLSSVLGVAKAKATCIRIYNARNDVCGFFHVWRSASTRLFNNMAIAVKNDEDADEYLRAIAEQFRVALELCGSPAASAIHYCRLERKRNRQLNKAASSRVFGQLSTFIGNVSSSVARQNQTPGGGDPRARVTKLFSRKYPEKNDVSGVSDVSATVVASEDSKLEHSSAESRRVFRQPSKLRQSFSAADIGMWSPSSTDEDRGSKDLNSSVGILFEAHRRDDTDRGQESNAVSVSRADLPAVLISITPVQDLATEVSTPDFPTTTTLKSASSVSDLPVNHIENCSPLVHLEANPILTTSRSEGSLKQLSTTVEGAEIDQSAAGGRFLKKLSNSRKMFGNSIFKFGDQMQNISQRALGKKIGAAQAAVVEQTSKRPLEQFVEQIRASKTTVLIL